VLGIAGIAEERGTSRSTTHRYVIALVALGYRQQHDTEILAENRGRWRELTAQVHKRRELYELAGWPGQPRAERTLTEHQYGALAIGVLTRHRETFAPRLARHDLTDGERSSLNERARLRDAHVAHRDAVEVERDHNIGEGESCQQ
jgi:hypothetical protein